jgi:hypothetical protein
MADRPDTSITPSAPSAKASKDAEKPFKAITQILREAVPEVEPVDIPLMPGRRSRHDR